MYWRILVDEKWVKMQNPEPFRAENEHLYRYMSSCTSTHGKKGGSVQPVPVHPSSEQPIPVQVKVVPI